MAGERSETSGVFCDFCRRNRKQVGVLTCLHRMCASCFPYYSNKLDKCYLCVLATAEVNRASMRIIQGSIEDDGDTILNEEKFFCSENECTFVGTSSELSTHGAACNLRKQAIAERQKKMLIPTNSLVSAQTSSDPAIPQADSQTNQDKASNLDEETPVKSDFVERATENLAPGTVLKLPATVAPKFSLEISDFVEVNRSPAESEAFDSNRSTSEIAETESDISYNAYEILHAEEMTVSSSTHPAEGPFSEGGRGHSFTEYEGEEGFEIHETLRRDDENFNDLGQEIEERSESYATDRAHSERRPRQEMLNFPWSKLFTFAMGVLAAALMLSDRKVSKNVPTMKHPGECDGYITWKMDNVTDLVARAQFNKRDLRLSEFITVRNYEVRLGVGSTFSVDENVVILWITAVVMKDDERPWPFEESMQLRLEHENPNLVESYNFTSDQKGQWREKRRNERKSLIFRQMQVETTKRLKYMRFSYYLTYDDAVAKGYIKSDSISVGFKLMPWGPSA